MELAAASPSVIDLEKQYLLQNYARYPLVLHRGKGCYVYDTAGKRYLDLIAGIGGNAPGYTHPRVTKGDREQGRVRVHCSPPPPPPPPRPPPQPTPEARA